MMPLTMTARRYFHIKLYKSAYSRAAFTLGGVVIMEIRSSFRQFFTLFPEENEIYRYLSEFGYALQGYILKNLILPGQWQQ